MMPFFSIIIPTYNRSQILPRAIDSVLNQSFQDFELIVVDDGSTDDTRTMLEWKYTGKVSYAHQQNAGVCAARNSGATMARGKFLIFLDSDDWLSDYCLTAYYKVLVKSEVRLLLGSITYLQPSGKKIREQLPIKRGKIYVHSLPGAFAITKEVFEELQGYDTNLAYSENSDLFLRIRLSGLILQKDIIAITDAGVLKIKEDESIRSKRYLQKKYDSVRYFLRKHQSFLDSADINYVNYTRILSYCAFSLGRYKEARNGMVAIIKRYPFSVKSYLQLIMFTFPVVTKFIRPDLKHE